MNRYRNVKNGHEIVIPSVLTSPLWEMVSAEEAEEKEPKEKAVKQDERNSKRVRKQQ